MPLKTIFQKNSFFLSIIIVFISLNSFSNDNMLYQDTSRDQISNGNLKVFLDLQYWADKNFIQQEIPIVDYVRDKELADVHIIMTRHGAGQAGTIYKLRFLGRRNFSGMDNELEYWSSSTETEHETRKGYTKMLKIGLSPYIVSDGSMVDKLSIDYEADSTQPNKIEETDPWKRWVFEIYGGGYFDSEQTRNSMHIRYGIYADKVTEDWKIRARPYFNYNYDDYQVNGSSITNITHRDGFHGYLIKSIGNHWGVGLFSNLLSSTYHNMDFQIETSPGIEYSLFPYSEATKRSISFAYKLNYAYNDYISETIYGETEETLWGQSIVLSVDFQQPWGSIRAGVNGSHHFHDFSSNSVELFSSLSLRLFKGFSLTVDAEFDFINDLVAIPMEDMSTEEILLEQRRRSTNYQFDGHIGFTYTFGSELSGDYNPRF